MKLFKKYRIKELKDGFYVERKSKYYWEAYDEDENRFWGSTTQYATRYKTLEEARQVIERLKKVYY